ncbi:MalY/PatB family protein [Pseudothauera hydrothermalis]|uniref:MalY/PatB family protein n=1 Tax=Pseudothauera hydrothermalis TaxID=2184083 RepID=UPI000E0953B6|nr:PatB family C-S lyase [Pseudothauera hydrothermalis]
MKESFDFDRQIDRRSVPGEKWGRYAGRDVLPMWVADMDFAAPAVILDALKARIDHGVFGYTEPWPSLIDAVIEHMMRHYGWRIEADWLVWLPGVVSGLNIACRISGEAGDEVFTATPVYPPFLTAPAYNGRRLVSRPLVHDGARWGWDRDAVEAAIGPRTRLFLLCNPHNPVGRVFDRDELAWIAALAERHDLLICSDEIHCGLVLDPNRPHLPIAALDEAVAQRSITLMAPSKTWNIASLYCALAIIPNPALRRRFRSAMRGIVPPVNVLGLVACEAAYRHGEAWRQALLAVLRENRTRIDSALQEMPGVRATPPEATYLAWLDCRDSGLDDPAGFFEAGGVGLSDGAPFGAPGFVRLNFGCPAGTLTEALTRMQRTLSNRTS